jgi:hypothetical protein
VRQPNKTERPYRPFSSPLLSEVSELPGRRTFRYRFPHRAPCRDARTLAQKRIASWRLPFPRAAPREPLLNRFLQISDLDSQISNFNAEITIFEFRISICDQNNLSGFCSYLRIKTGPGNFGESLLVCLARIMPRARAEVNSLFEIENRVTRNVTL